MNTFRVTERYLPCMKLEVVRRGGSKGSKFKQEEPQEPLLLSISVYFEFWLMLTIISWLCALEKHSLLVRGKSL